MSKPKIGMVICDCRFKHQEIVKIDSDGDTVTLADGHVCSFIHCTDKVPHNWNHPNKVTQ